MGAGGFVGMLQLHSDGTIISRNDTTPGHIWMPETSTTIGYWRSLFIPGLTYPDSDYVYRNTARRTYEVCFGDASNSDILLACSGGFVWKSTNRGYTWTKLAGYKGGVIQDDEHTTLWNENVRIGYPHMRVSPTDPNNIGVCPVSGDGLMYSLDGGTTWQTNASVPTPTGSAGGSIHFVSDTEVWVVVRGTVAMRSTTGVGGTFSTVAGGPTIAASIDSGGGNVYFVGDDEE